MKEAIVLSAALLILLAGCASPEKPQAPPEVGQNVSAAGNDSGWQPQLELNSEECAKLGGEIVNTLGTPDCPEGEKSLGEVVGLRCPCICCVKS